MGCGLSYSLVRHYALQSQLSSTGHGESNSRPLPKDPINHCASSNNHREYERGHINQRRRSLHFFRNVTFQAAVGGLQAIPSLCNFFSRFANLTDLILLSLPHYNGNVPIGPPLPLVMPQATAMSLRRLFLMNSPAIGHAISAALRETRNLECLYLVENGPLDFCSDGLPMLRELCIVSNRNALSVVAVGVACGKFPKLEVLIYASRLHLDPKGIEQLITAELPMRILVIAGQDQHMALSHCTQQMIQAINPAAAGSVFQEAIIPPRPDYRAGGQLRFPPLQIFVGGDFTKNVRFRLSPSNVARFWRIDRPMPEFLEQAQVAAVFGGVWVAKLIRDGPGVGVSSWGSPHEGDKFFTTGQLLFR